MLCVRQMSTFDIFVAWSTILGKTAPMPYTVPFSFDKFVENISITGDHRETAETRKKAVVSLLENDFTILDSFSSGSIPRLTALKSLADLDVMVVLHWTKHIKDKGPSQVLKNVRDALGKYRTDVRRNGQAVTLHYESWPNVDIVPVSRSDNEDGTVNHYNVPDMNTGKWLSSRPRKHSATLDSKASTCGERFRPIIRMIKQWNKEHSDLLESFHIEVMAIAIFIGNIDEYTWHTYRFFDEAVKLASGSLAYEDGYADDYLDSANRKEVVKRLETARDKARSAWHLTYNGRSEHKEAIEIWRQIFGDKFPTYG
jgi:hypothetical protein